jgi:perosamine synthetase
MKKIPLYKPYTSENQINAIENVLTSGWWGYGNECNKLENKFISKNEGWAIATSSGTSALSIIANLLKDDNDIKNEIIIPAITWISTAVAFLKADFKIKLAEVDDSLLIDFGSVKNQISNKTKAIVLVHLYGQKIDVKKFKELANTHNITLIEDRAHLVDFENKIISDYCAYSFNVLKELSSGEGGLIWGKDNTEYEKAKSISNLGLSENTFSRTNNPIHNKLIFTKNIGLKLQSNDISASITNYMFSIKDALLLKRVNIFNKYEDGLKDIPFIELLNRNKKVDSKLMFVIKIKKNKRDLFRKYLAEKGISTSIHYQSLSFHPLIYDKTPFSDKIASNLVTLPCYPELNEFDLSYIISSIKSMVL